MTNQEVLTALQSKFGEAIVSHSEFRGELTVVINRASIVEVCRFLKDDASLAFGFLADLCGIDMYRSANRFGVVYNVYSYNNRLRIRLKTFAEEDDPRVPSVTSVWPTANWHERETYDMFGIHFEGHPDLRRIYMPEDFQHHPLRKDFPLMGIPGSIPLPKK